MPCPQHWIANTAATGSCRCFDRAHQHAGFESEPTGSQATEEHRDRTDRESAKEQPAEQRELLTIKQLVAYSGLSERTLRGYLHRPVQPLPHYRVAKKILIRRSEFDEWLIQFQRAANGDEIGRAVDELFSGLTGPRPRANTPAHPMRRG